MEVLCSMWNGTPMQLCSLYLCFMKKHHTFVSERPGHGEFGKKSKRNKVLKSELGGLFSSLQLFPFMYKGDTSTFDNWSSGFYSTAINITDGEEKPSGADPNGTLLVFNSGYHGLQVYKTFNLPDFYIRTKGGSFRSPWYKFTGVQI